VVLEALSALARRRRDERDGTAWDPAQPLLAGRQPPPPDEPHHDSHLGHD
jgi:agmatinase